MTLIQSGEPKGSLLVQIRKIKGETNMPSQSIFDMKVSKVYPLLLQKVCGIAVESIEDPLMQKIRWLDKLVDELAKGKPLNKILR